MRGSILNMTIVDKNHKPDSTMAHILVIDDDPDIRNLVSAYLESEGYTVSQAENGEDGVDKAAQTIPALIILDINMPVMDGTRVMQALQKVAATSDVPVIALSAMSGSGMRDDMHQLGCRAFVDKPIDPTVLLSTVKKLVAS